MWYSKLTFFDKQSGLSETIPDDFFTKPYSESELGVLNDIRKLYPDGSAPEIMLIEANLRLPDEYIELLKYSNGGGILNGEREFGYFSPAVIREMYVNYGFPFWAPEFLPMAFNGGGKFYAYDFREENQLQIIVVSSGNIGYKEDCWAFLGNTLEEVLNKTTNVENELD